MNVVNVLFYIHPDLSDEQCMSLEESLSSINGVMHANLNRRQHHEINISYDPDAISAQSLRKQLREWDKDARVIDL